MLSCWDVGEGDMYFIGGEGGTACTLYMTPPFSNVATGSACTTHYLPGFSR